MIRAFAAGLVVLGSFIVVVFGLIEAVVILDLFPARTVTLAPTTIVDRRERQFPGGLGRWTLGPGQVLRGLGPGWGLGCGFGIGIGSGREVPA